RAAERDQPAHLLQAPSDRGHGDHADPGDGRHRTAGAPSRPAPPAGGGPARVPAGVEEMLRMVSPVIAFARTAKEETEIRGIPIAKDDYVVLLYPSANRDEDVWPDPDRFDVTRPQRRNLAFGFGPHVCLGAPLARMEGRLIFQELLARFPDFELAGPPVKRPSTLVSMYDDLPVV